MIAILRDKAWARRFARTGGDLGITHAGPRYRYPIRIWQPTAIPQKQRRYSATVPADLSPREPSAPSDPAPAGVMAAGNHSHTQPGVPGEELQ